MQQLILTCVEHFKLFIVQCFNLNFKMQLIYCFLVPNVTFEIPNNFDQLSSEIILLVNIQVSNAICLEFLRPRNCCGVPASACVRAILAEFLRPRAWVRFGRVSRHLWQLCPAATVAVAGGGGRVADGGRFLRRAGHCPSS